MSDYTGTTLRIAATSFAISALALFSHSSLAQTAQVPPQAKVEKAKPSPWQIFMQHSEVEGAYKGKDGTYVVLVPRGTVSGTNYANSSAWRNAVAAEPSLSGFIERNSDDVGAIFFIKNGSDQLISQNIVGFNTVFDGDYNHTTKDIDFKAPSVAQRNNGYTVANILTRLNVMSWQGYTSGVHESVNEAPEDAKLGHTFSYQERDAFLTCADGSEVKFVRDAAAEKALKDRLAKGTLQLANLVPNGLAWNKGSLLDKATGNVYVVAGTVKDSNILVSVVSPDNMQIMLHELTAANPARRGVSSGGYNLFYKTGQGDSFVAFTKSDFSLSVWGTIPIELATLTSVGTKQKIQLSPLAETDPILAQLKDVKIEFGGRRLVFGTDNAYAGNPAIVDIPHACPVVPRNILSLESRGYAVRWGNDGG